MIMGIVNLTIDDCLKMYNRGISVVISNGSVIGFQQEEIPTQTANPSGDK